MPLYVRTLLITAPADEVGGALQAHRGHLAELKRAGRLRAAGEFANGEGFLDIFEAADLHDADGIARSSPLVEGGLGTWMLREWEELEV